MTVIMAGIENGKAWIGSDSRVSSGDMIVPVSEGKVLKLAEGVLIGNCGSHSIAQLIKDEVSLEPPKHDYVSADDYMGQEIIPKIREVLNKHKLIENGEMDAAFMVCCKGAKTPSVFLLYSDFARVQITEHAHAIGSGASFAMGAFMALPRNLPIKERFCRAMEITAQLCMSVSAPFHMECLE